MSFYKIREVRKAAKITQEELAQKLGVNRATISKYESGTIDLPTSQLYRIADALGVLVTQLIDFSNIDLSDCSSELSDSLIDSRVMLSRAIANLDIAKKRNASPEEIKNLEDTCKKISRNTQELTNLLVESKRKADFHKSLDAILNAPPGPFDLGEEMKWNLSYGSRASAEIVKSLKKLNDDGQREAVKRVAELTEIPKYQKEDSSKGIQESPEDKK